MMKYSNKLSKSNIRLIKEETNKFIKEGVKKSQLPSYMTRWFMEARDEVFKSDYHQAKLGCVIVYKSHIIGRGHNQLKTHPVQKLYNNKYRDFTNAEEFSKTCGHVVHAEIDALNSIPYTVGLKVNWKKVKVFIYRIGVGLDDYTGLALPCIACAKSLSKIGIRNVYYTTGNKDKPFGHCDL